MNSQKVGVLRQTLHQLGKIALCQSMMSYILSEN